MSAKELGKVKAFKPKERKFLKAFFENNLNETDAYLAIVTTIITRESAAVLGSRMMKRIKKKLYGRNGLKYLALAKAGCCMSLIANYLRRSLNIIWINLSATMKTIQRRCEQSNCWPICWVLKSRRSNIAAA